jgi:large subunit ribosomal protein L29
VKAEDLRTLDGDELTSRLKGARRELYELRFKLAVGQLDDHRQIRKVRKDIAKILTVVHARRLGEEIMVAPVREEVAEAPEAQAESAVAVATPEAEAEVADESEAAAEATNEETPENVETAEEAPAPAPASRRRSRKTAGEQE